MLLGLCAFGFQVIPHPSCYFTSIMGKTHHGPVIVLFSVKLHRRTSVDTRAGASYVSLTIISLINQKANKKPIRTESKPVKTLVSSSMKNI